jgi:preprotein translocase subunit SecY
MVATFPECAGPRNEPVLHEVDTITLAGASSGGIAILPVVLYRALNVPFEVASFFGGTSILITVGAMLDTLKNGIPSINAPI